MWVYSQAKESLWFHSTRINHSFCCLIIPWLIFMVIRRIIFILFGVVYFSSMNEGWYSIGGSFDVSIEAWTLGIMMSMTSCVSNEDYDEAIKMSFSSTLVLSHMAIDWSILRTWWVTLPSSISSSSTQNGVSRSILGLVGRYKVSFFIKVQCKMVMLLDLQLS